LHVWSLQIRNGNCSIQPVLCPIHMILFHDILKDTIFFRTYKMSQERGVICPDQKVVRLQNPGTWCYANASINFLFSSPVFVNYIRNCFENPNRSPLIEQLHALLIQNNEDIGSIEAILKIVSRNNDPNTDFRRQRQQDAAEFITTLLDHLKDTVQESEKRQFTMLFETQVENKRTCTLSNLNGCQTVNEIEIIPPIIALPIENCTSLEQSMTIDYGRSEKIEVNCRNICESTSAEQTNNLKKIARVLIVQFKRTYFHNGKIKKNGCPLDIPLRFQPMHSGDWYMLTGILQQKGEEATSGHYITFTRNILDKNVNFIISNDDAPQLIRPFQDVSHDIKCSYMFIYTPEEFVQEAITMITDTTIEDPRSPARKKNRQEEEQEEELTCEEEDFIQLVKEIEEITLIPPKERTEDQKKKLRNMKSKHKKLEKDFQHLDTLLKQKPKTAAEKKAAYRQKQTAETREKVRAADQARKAALRADMDDETMEEVRAANRAGMAAYRAGLDDETMEEVRAANRAGMAAYRAGLDDETMEEVRAANRAGMAAYRAGLDDETMEVERESLRYRVRGMRANVSVKPKDGLQSEKVLLGQFQVSVNNIGEMSHLCQFCHARKFKNETGMTCCLNGKISLKRFTKPTDTFLQLWFKDNQESRVFRKFSRSFNNGLCLSSLRVNERRFRGYTPSIVFEGRVHQYVGPLQAKEGEEPRFAQLFVHDPALEKTARVANMQMPATLSLEERQFVNAIVENLQEDLKQINPFVKDFRQIVELSPDDLQGGRLVISAKARPQGEHERRYNLSVNLQEVSVLTDSRPHDLVITLRDGGLQVVSDLNPNAMPLHFTVLFPWGDKGWDPEARNENTNKRLTAREFFIYHLAIRDKPLTYEEASKKDVVDYIHRGGRLFQEWICMAWITTENQRLNYQELNQKALRADTYRNVRQVINARQLAVDTRGDDLYPDDNALRVGTKILSRAFVCSPRWYHMQFLDAMAICREYHKPDFFITMTCNPNWEEIKKELLPDQNPEDRPDIVVAVFKQKLDALMNDLIKGALLGNVAAYLYVVEFQKRGLPHVHILLILAENDRLTTDEQVDAVICAELPPDPTIAENGADKEQMQELENIVKMNMIHGPCGIANPTAPCMQDGKCTKSFPKEFRKHTIVDPENGFPTYRRRAPEDGGRTINMNRGGIPYQATNRDVVPYNPFLSLRYKCHINVEKSTSPRNAKYLYKYVTKGPDRSMVSAELDDEDRPRDEIADYKDLRYVCK